VFDGATILHSWRLTTMRERTGDELGLLVEGLFANAKLDRKRITGVILASVVPPLTAPAQEMVQRYFGIKTLTVDTTIETGMPILYDRPADVGADRIVNGIAAFEKYGRAGKCALVVVDFGTATTLDAISAKGEYLGGAICPGVTISAEALFQRAARLPKIDVRKPATVIGRTTVGAMESGLFWGYVDMVEGLVRRMSAELGGNVQCVATGGLASIIAPETNLIQHVDPDLTLDGLRIVWDRNQ
jgi:type III pantothenate kinase